MYLSPDDLKSRIKTQYKVKERITSENLLLRVPYFLPGIESKNQFIQDSNEPKLTSETNIKL